MRKILAIAILSACGNSAQLSPPMDAGPQAGDLAQLSDLALKEMSATVMPDMTMAAQPDLSTAAADAALPMGCGPNQIVDRGQCWDIRTQAQCDALSRQYIPLVLVGYCGGCKAPAQDFFGYCAAPSCANSQGSLGALCQALGRGCSDDGVTAMCNGCRNAAATLDPTTQACVPTTCSARSDCPELAGFYCTQLNANDAPQCRKRQCAAGQSWNRATQACTDCSSCGSGGEWPVTDSQGVCYCTTQPGQFYNHILAKHDVEQCDSDQDGWIKKEVQDELMRVTSTGHTDYTVLFNVQCVLPVFTSVVLLNEWQQTKTLSMSDIGVTGTGVPMYEHSDNDTGGNPDFAYPLGGRLDPRMVNSLTKSCSSKKSDLNRNGAADVGESQAASTPADGFEWTLPYQRITYFMELYQSHFEKTGDGGFSPCLGCVNVPAVTGKLVIEERLRCHDDFPMQPISANNEYWTECTRRRDGSYDSTKPGGEIGYDFAEYDCSSAAGACSETPPIGGPSSDGTVPAHGVCNHGVPGAAWRGMTAYSQFMCAQITTAAPPLNHNQISPSDVTASATDNRPWEAFSCGLNPPSEGPPPDAGVESEAFSCSERNQTGAKDGDVVWLMRRYQPGGYSSAPAYPGGCIDEGTEWKQLCLSDPTDAVGNDAAFGLIECPPACSQDELFKGDTTHPANGFALCFHRSLTSFDTGSTWQFGDSSGYSMSGEIPMANSATVLSSGICNADGTSPDTTPDGGCIQLR